ncbi:hypothetical protein AQ505_09455 [Pedobacter sp. PACM 27299]|nr:hypothetical protein AQ505_09455 [Pedobacter sp. PACM 27299]
MKKHFMPTDRKVLNYNLREKALPIDIVNYNFIKSCFFHLKYFEQGEVKTKPTQIRSDLPHYLPYSIITKGGNIIGILS